MGPDGATPARRKAGGGAKARPGRTTTALRRARDTYIPVYAPIRRSDLHDDDNPEWTLPDCGVYTFWLEKTAARSILGP